MKIIQYLKKVIFFRTYFENNYFNNSTQCLEYTKGKLDNIIKLQDNIIEEINTAKLLTKID